MFEIFLQNPEFRDAISILQNSIAQGVSPADIMNHILLSPPVMITGRFNLDRDNFQEFPDVMNVGRVIECCNQIMDYLNDNDGSAFSSDIHTFINPDTVKTINIGGKSRDLLQVCLGILSKNQYIWMKRVNGKHLYTIVNRSDFLVLCKEIRRLFDDFIDGRLRSDDRSDLIDLLDVFLHEIYDNGRLTQTDARQICEDNFDNRKVMFGDSAVTMFYLLRDFFRKQKISVDPLDKTAVMKLARM
jgi:hypothetical protein